MNHREWKVNMVEEQDEEEEINKRWTATKSSQKIDEGKVLKNMGQRNHINTTSPVVYWVVYQYLVSISYY